MWRRRKKMPVIAPGETFMFVAEGHPPMFFRVSEVTSALDGNHLIARDLGAFATEKRE